MADTLSGNNIELTHGRDFDVTLIQTIRESVGWLPDSTEIWQQTMGSALDVVSAWDGDKVVGIGFLVGSPRHAILCDIAVSPEHQKRGIGREIAQILIHTAQELKIKYVTLTFAEDKPWLVDFYGSLGFRSIDNAMQLTVA